MNTTITTRTNPGTDRPPSDTPLLDQLGRLAGEATKRLSIAAAVKGVLAVLFGVVLLAWPAPTVLALVLTFGTFAVVEGTVAIWSGVTKAPSGQRWPVVLQGTAGVLTGIVTLAWPGATALVLMYMIGVWALTKGCAEIGLASRLHRDGRSWGYVAISGTLAALFGIGVIVHPGAGAVALIGLIATLALVTGVACIAAAITLHHRRHTLPAAN
jgi:uncharacterized membrane protein HdeD (DUF308 family)